MFMRMGYPTSGVLVFILVVIVRAMKDPCVIYEDIVETDSVHELYHRKGGLIHNDQEMNCRSYTPAEQWYRPRFKYASDLTTSCADRVKCGTMFPVWMTERVPDAWEGVVNRTVCRRGGEDCCANEWNIRVKNCGKFRVYRLLPVDFCLAAYCFEQEHEEKSRLLDHVIIGAGAAVLIISTMAIIVTCLYRRRKMRLLREKWAVKRRELRERERTSRYIVGMYDGLKKTPSLLFTTAPTLTSPTASEETPRQFSETPRAWEDALPVQEKVPM